MTGANAVLGAPKDVVRFRDVIGTQLGLSFDDTKLGFLAEVLRRRLESSRDDLETYLGRLEATPAAEEMGALAQELTVPETYFFRNSDQFRALTELVLPERVGARRASRTLRLLSAGCASGDEPYSLAISVRDALPEPGWDVSITGVDVNPTILERAARGRFTSWSLRDTPPHQRRWFRAEGRELVLDDTIRAAVRFAQHNLSQDDPALWASESYDVVFCRNVIMYLTPEVARAVVARIFRALAPGGYLFLGHAETLRALSQDFHLRHTHGTFYYQRKNDADVADVTDDAARPGRVSTPVPSDVASTLAPSVSVFHEEDSTSWVDAIQRASARIGALARSAAPARDPPAAAAKPDLRTALELLARERFADALSAVRDLPSPASRDPDALLLEAVLLAHGGQLAEAEAACARLLAIDELCAGAHYVLAMCREAAGDLRGAADHDRVASYLDPAFAMPRLHLGLLAKRAGDRAGARRELGQARLLLQREDAARVLLFGGGFGRESLVALCAAELAGERP
jgi:chemotaxis protein methyltransferase CheR